MNDHYVFGGPSARPLSGPLPAGDYSFVVADTDSEPHFKNDHWIFGARLSIEPSGATVFSNSWSGVDRNGTARDGIGEFLLAIGRAPAPGEEPNWASLVGAKGKCRLKIEVASEGAFAGKERNTVSFFHTPKQLASPQGGQSQSAGVRVAGTRRRPTKEELDQGPDDIPF